jgi:vancomycin permeability regulator SanA
MKLLRRGVLAIVLLVALLFAPLVYFVITTPIVDIENARPSDAALIFGALVSDGKISPLHEERLNAGQELLDEQIAGIVVVSNSARAAKIMQQYLVNQGVAPHQIIIDGKADKTPDTCRNEMSSNPQRSVIMISQRFHLPRVALQCRNIGITGQYLAADRFPRRSSGLWTKIRVRTYRYSREAVLIWAELLGLYQKA